MKIIKAAAALAALPLESARQVYIADVQARRISGSLEDLGFEAVDEAGPVTKDGREIVRVRGRDYALRPEVHAEMLAAAFAEKKAQRKGQVNSQPGESLTSVLCPSCQSAMAKSPICPNCAKGKAGFKILCICTECAHEVYL